MKKWIAIFFIVALAGTLLPAVLSYDQKKIVLLSAVEEEQPESGKDVKAKEDLKAFFSPAPVFNNYTTLQREYPHLAVLFSDDPLVRSHTPPPDIFC